MGISKMIAWGENALILFLWKCLEISLGNLYESIGGWRVKSSQCAKQVVSDSLAWVGLVDFVIRLVIFVLYYIHFEITGYPCNLIGSQQCDLFLNCTIFCSKRICSKSRHSCSKTHHFSFKSHHFCSISHHFCFEYKMRCKSLFVSAF